MTPGCGKTKSDVWYTMNSLSSALLSETLCFSNVFKYIVLIHCIVCDVFLKQILTFDTCIGAFCVTVAHILGVKHKGGVDKTLFDNLYYHHRRISVLDMQNCRWQDV